MDRRLSELPNRISTQDLTHRSGAIFMVKVHRPKFSGKKQLNCLRKVRLVDKGLMPTRVVVIVAILFS